MKTILLFYFCLVTIILSKHQNTSRNRKMTPSIYLKEMQLNTPERMLKLSTIGDAQINSGPNHILSFTPKLLLYQNFGPGGKIPVKFTIKNLSQTTTFLSMVFKKTSNFTINPSHLKTSRLAPGISATFTVTFTPDHFQDYMHRVDFLTDDNKYILPIIALGPRPLFNFPDEVKVPKTPLKIENSCMITIRNIGRISAGFSLTTKCPFYVFPKSAQLSPGEAADVRISFKSMHLGEFYGSLVASYDTGENIIISLTCSTYSVDVQIDQHVVRFLKTYNTMSRHLTVKIHNQSPNVLSYMCMRHESVGSDFDTKMGIAHDYYRLKENESIKCRKLVEYEILSCNDHERVYSRIFEDELQALVADETLTFQDTNYSLTPIKGKLWPNVSTEITVVFAPKVIGDLETFAYLDIDGVEGRVPLRLTGSSLAPDIKLNVETLDMDYVYVNNMYYYELIAMNKGHINGVLVYKEAPVLFGSIITCKPETLCLVPGAKEGLILSFINNNLGPFFEEIQFKILDTDITIKIYLKGELVYPTLNFSKNILDFGTVSAGVPTVKEFEVANESSIAVTADLKIVSDGPEVNSISLTDFAVPDIPKPDLPVWPKEFNIEPNRLFIDPESQIIVKIVLTANLLRTNHTSLELELLNADSPAVSLPITYKAMVPEIQPNGDIFKKACFMDHPYPEEISFTSNELIGYFVLEATQDGYAIQVEILRIEGFIEPNSVIRVPIVIKTNELGMQTSTIRMKLFGLTEPIDICHITIFGVAPIITYLPLAMHWGHVKLLNRVDKILSIINDSPIDVFFEALLQNDDGKWHIPVQKGTLLAETTYELIVSLCLSDADTYQNRLVIRIDDLKDTNVPLSATGVGTSITVGNLTDRVILGRHFTKILMDCNVIMENCGSRLHTLEWTRCYKQAKTKSMPPAFFTLEPSTFKMTANEKMDLRVTGHMPKPSSMTETWFLIGSIEGINKKELLMECAFEAEFVDTQIEVSTDLIELQYDYGPYSERYNLTDVFTIKNVSTLPLDVEVTVRHPFAFVLRNSSYKIEKGDDALCDCICYNISDLNIDALMHESEPFMCKLFIDYLTERPVPPVRTDYLRFFQEINKLKVAFNLTQYVNEYLEDGEAMRLQIVFDTTKHTNLRSKEFCDLVRIKFKKHKNKDMFRVIGRINFPNLSVTPPLLDFGCVPCGSVNSKTIEINNFTPLTVTYEFQWKDFTYTEIPQNSLIDHMPKINLIPSDIENKNEDDILEILASHAPMSEYNLGFLSKNLIETVKEETNSELFNVCDIEVIDEQTKVLTTVTPLLTINEEIPLELIRKLPITPQPVKLPVHDVITVVPHRGSLKAGECQYINVTFSPKNNVKIRANLQCSVLGGPAETVKVMGEGSTLKYALNTDILRFRIRPYHERATENLIILNSGLLTFGYKTYLKNNSVFGRQDAKLLDITPPLTSLKPNEEVTIKVTVNPGIMGYFYRSFLLEIGPLPAITINVTGWGVFPQVYLSFQRPGIEKIPEEVSYRAISTLTSEFIEAINLIFTLNSPSHVNTPLSEQDSISPETVYPEDWYICNYNDGYPSGMDIELAMERILVIDHIQENPETLKALADNKKGPIPGVITIPYVIDYGVVIIGTTVVCGAEVVNYSPNSTRLFMTKADIPRWLEIKLCGKIESGATSKFEVIFSPTSEDFTQLEEALETTFHLEVPWGVFIPLVVTATCAVPYLVTNIKKINYGQVRCGDKVVCSLPLKNVGKATCIWFVTMKLKNRGPNPITIINGSGKYEPGEGGFLEVAFKPTLETKFKGELIFKFHMNPMRLVLPLVGHGALPRVHVIGANINFPPTLPWEQTTHLYFGLTNPCSFPIELIFAHTDEKWKQEEEIYQILYNYYDRPDEMLVPAILPGHGLPVEIVTFFSTLMERVRSKAQKKTMRTSAPKPTTENPFRRTGAEIIADELAVLKSENADPLKEAVECINGNMDTDDKEEQFGVLIFTYGSPFAEVHAMELAYSIGMRLNLPVINIDTAVVEALCSVNSQARTVLVSFLNETYRQCLNASGPSASHIRKTSPEEHMLQEEEAEDDDTDFDVIYKKLYLISNSKPVVPQTAEKKKKKPQSTPSNDFCDAALTSLPLDLLMDLLKQFFGTPRFMEGFVVDTLNSWVLKQPAHALTTMLKCKPLVKSVQLVICHSEFLKWAVMYEEKERQKELHAIIEESKEMDETEIQMLIQEFDEMYASDYENSSPDLRSVYVNVGLEERRTMFLEKCPTARSGKYASGKDHHSTKSVHGPDLSLSKKSKKVDTGSRTTPKKNDLKSGKATSEYLMMNMKFNEYQKNVFDQLLNIANNWCVEVCELGVPLLTLNGAPVGGAGPKKENKKKQTEVRVAVSQSRMLDRGFPLIVVTCPCLDYKESVLRMLEYCPIIKAARTPKPPVDILTLPAGQRRYTVLASKVFPAMDHVACLQFKYLEECPIKKCDCNPLGDLRELDDNTQENVIDILSMWHCTCGKKSSTSTSTSTDVNTAVQLSQDQSQVYIYPQPLNNVASLISHKKRIILQPGDLLRLKYSFSPQLEGKYSVKRFVEVSGWPDSRVIITATGICDLPRLDQRPKKVFSNFARRTAEKVVYKHVFLDDRKVFEFGPIFIGADRVYEEYSTFSIRNSSLLKCDVKFSFLEEFKLFNLGEPFLSLEPGCREDLKVLAAPSTLGDFRTTLICSIKENPDLVKIHISCSGVIPHVQILPASKIIDYGKLLLYRREKDRFIVKNDSILPILWKIRNIDDFLENFILAETSGVVERNDNQVVLVTYIACQVGIINNMPLIIDIYDSQGRGAPMLTVTLMIAAECYDVQVDCAFEDPEDTGLNYGDVKVNSQVCKQMFFLNRGKYEIFYKIKKMKNFPEPAFLRTIEVSQDCGVIPPNMKMVGVDFSCAPTTRVDLQNVPAFVCSFIDGSNNQVVVSKYPINLSIASFYNTFTLFPLGELNFHVIPVGVISSREITINNTSRCPFTYEIEVPPFYKNEVSAAPITKQKDSKKAAIPILKCGSFSIINDDSIVAPGTSRKIEVSFFATKAIRFEEVINFVVSDTCPAEALGVPLTLVGTGAIPTLDIWNLDTTFREHLILKNLSDYHVQETCPHCILVEDSVTLHFFCVAVNRSHTANVDLYNNGLVTANVTMKLNYQENCDSSIFYLDNYSALIEPLVHRKVEIVFAPKCLQEYRAVLEVHLKLSLDKEEVYKICLIGEGVIPRINISKPTFKESKTSSIQFPATLINSLSSKAIRMTNISTVNCMVILDIGQKSFSAQPTFWLTVFDETTERMLRMYDSEEFNTGIKLELVPKALATVHVCYTPSEKGKHTCDVKVLIINNPYEYFTIVCNGEAFLEDVILTGIDSLPANYEVEIVRPLPTDAPLKCKEASVKKKSPENKKDQKKKDKKGDSGSNDRSDANENAILKYVLNLGGCELGTLHRRSATLVNNSLKVYKFSWHVIDTVAVKPDTGYISPGEEKDVEINFLSNEGIVIDKVNLYCFLVALGSDSLEMKGQLWESRQTVTVFERSRNADIYKRVESIVEDPKVAVPEEGGPTIDIVVVFSAVVDYVTYTCSLNQNFLFKDTFMYQTRCFDIEIANTGVVPMKISWSYQIDEHYPTRIDAVESKQEMVEEASQASQAERYTSDQTQAFEATVSEEDVDFGTLYSDCDTRASADTWFEAHLPFSIEPSVECIAAGQKRTFKATFAPMEAFNYKVRLCSYIEKLHPDYTNVSVRVAGRSLVPYCHLEAEESDYVTAGRRKANLPALPPNTRVMEFNVLGAGCYKKTLSVINPTSEAYQFFLEAAASDSKELVPVHCDTLGVFLHSGTTTDICFTFAPSAPGVYESLWKFRIAQHNFEVDYLVVGIVREPDVSFVPTILILEKTLVGGSTTSLVRLRNREPENLTFKFTGNSLCNESGKQPVVVEPAAGTVNASSDACINVSYKPLASGNLSFKIFCEVSSLVKPLVLCVNALSHLIKPKVTYFLLHYEHELLSDAITNIHMDKVASHYERFIRFVIKNEGTVEFHYQWQYVNDSIKKYMDIEFDPLEGIIPPGHAIESVMSFTIRDIPVVGYPVTLHIMDGPEFNIYLHAEINKPIYRFSFTNFDFGKCIVNAPDTTYQKNIVFCNNDSVPITLNLNFINSTEIFVEFNEKLSVVQPTYKLRIPVYFRPKEITEYKFVLPFRVNSLVEQDIVIRGEGVPLMFDLYEGCQKNMNLGAVRVGGRAVVREVEVMNHSKVPVEGYFTFEDTYPLVDDASDTDSRATSDCLAPSPLRLGPLQKEPASRVKMLKQDRNARTREKQSLDIQNAFAALRVVPTRAVINPHCKIPIKIHFKPMGLIKTLDMQLCMRVFTFTKPLVKLSGCATGMSLRFSQNSLQFGPVKRHGCKTLKMMLFNKGDIGARFFWQPLCDDVFTITPMEGTIAPQSTVTFSISFKPTYINPFVKTWGICNIENYHPLELALYGCCLDLDYMDTKTITFQCSVRDSDIMHVNIDNHSTYGFWVSVDSRSICFVRNGGTGILRIVAVPDGRTVPASEDVWNVLPTVTGSAFETLKSFTIQPKCSLEVPVYFKPRTMGEHEGNVLFAPLGESALYFLLSGMAGEPLPNGVFELDIVCKEIFTENLPVYNLSEFPETYVVQTEVMRVVPEQFTGYYEIKCPKIVKVWGEAQTTCRWSIVIYEECTMHLKVKFINQETREYQFFFVVVKVNPSTIVDTIELSVRARETVQKFITFTNPLSEDVPYIVTCANEYIKCDEQVVIPRNSQAQFSVTYSPLVTGESVDFLEIGHLAVGVYVYRLRLECLPAKEKSLNVSTPLGTAVPMRLRVHNRSDKLTQFTTTNTNSSFIVNKEYPLAAGEKGKFLIWYEPTDIGLLLGQISFKSPVAGEFVFNIEGTALAPKPQGPIEIKSGASTMITFKNVFEDLRTFKIRVDQDDFSVKTGLEMAKPKKEIKFPVYLRKLSPEEEIVCPTGCLTIECQDPAEPRVMWTYFLQGIP